MLYRYFSQMTKIAVCEYDAFAERLESMATTFDSTRIGVDTQETSLGMRSQEYAFGVSGASYRSIDVETSGLWVQGFKNSLVKKGRMNCCAQYSAEKVGGTGGWSIWS